MGILYICLILLGFLIIYDADSAVVDGVWSTWITTASFCSITCGQGQRTVVRKRNCDSPPPSSGGKYCRGGPVVYKYDVCKKDPCPYSPSVDGGWSSWVLGFGRCSVTCGKGQRKIVKNRKCDNPFPSNGGKYCRGDSDFFIYKECTPNVTCGVAATEVAEDGWSPWVTKMTPCSATCGKGQRTIIKQRICNNTAAGEESCKGDRIVFSYTPCDTSITCPDAVREVIDGAWSSWDSSVTTCLATCGQGQRAIVKKRMCNNPRPSNGGQYCEGEPLLFIYQECRANITCPPKGVWSSWKTYVISCSATCGEGRYSKHYMRACLNPKPFHPCRGQFSKAFFSVCRTNVTCPEKQQNGSCTNSSDCNGKQQNGSCTNSSDCNGKQQNGSCTNSSDCNVVAVDGQWSRWTVDFKGICKQSCTRSMSYTRTCTNPAPAGEGRKCVGFYQKHKVETCKGERCGGAVMLAKAVSKETMSEGLSTESKAAIAVVVCAVSLALLATLVFYRWPGCKNTKVNAFD